MALMLSEDSNPNGQKAVLETAWNRANAHGAKDPYNPEYYAPFKDGSLQRNLARVRSDPALRERLSKSIDEVGGGSNYSVYGTQNSSDAPGNAVASHARQTQTPTWLSPTGEQFSRKDRPEFGATHGVLLYSTGS